MSRKSGLIVASSLVTRRQFSRFRSESAAAAAAGPGGMGQGNDQERAACHPDVTKYCQVQLQVNPNDVLGILGCLQANRTKISKALPDGARCHGQ